MKKSRIATISLAIMLAMAGILGCSNFMNNSKDINPADSVEIAKNDLSIGFAADDTAAAVTKNLILATMGDDEVSISWVSSNPSIVATTGVVTRPAFGQPNAAVTLTATITKNGITETKTFEISVLAYPDSSHADVLAAMESLALGFSGGDTADAVTGNLTLCLAGANDVAISWATSDAAAVSATGVVARPAAGQPDAVVTLTATLVKGPETETKTFAVTIKAELYRYTVSYYGNGYTQGTVPTDSNRYVANAGVTVAAQGDLLKTGHSFAGWNTRADGSGIDYTPGASFLMPGESLTLYAKWAASGDTAYQVQHYWQDASGSGYALHETESLSGTTGAMATAAAKSYTGFAEDTGHESRAASGTIAADGSLVLKLYYNRSTYTVTFNSNGGTAVSSTTGVRYGATISSPTSPTKTGYTFAGWHKEAGLTNVWSFASDTVTTATTLYAKWTALPTYRVTYSGNDSSAGTVPSDTHDYLAGASATVLGNTGALAKTGGYYFAGWNTKADGTGTDYAAGASITIQDDLTLYAKWTKYVVTKHVVIFRDEGSEWTYDDTYGTLLRNEIGMSEGSGIAQYEYKTSADIPLYMPTVGDILIIAASQPAAFYDAYRTHRVNFDSFVNLGGEMFWVYADCGNPWGKYDSTLPGGVVKNYASFEKANDIVDNVHPIMEGIPLGSVSNLYTVSTSGFSNLDSLAAAGTISGVRKLMVQKNDRMPTLIEYAYGSGKVLATTITLDFFVSYWHTWQFQTITVNSLKYLLDLI